MKHVALKALHAHARALTNRDSRAQTHTQCVGKHAPRSTQTEVNNVAFDTRACSVNRRRIATISDSSLAAETRPVLLGLDNVLGNRVESSRE